MDNKIRNLMLALIRRQLNGGGEASFQLLSEEEANELYRLSAKHDLAHIVGNTAITEKIISADHSAYKLFSKQIMLAVYRGEQRDHDLDRIGSLMEQEGIFYTPLKGSVLKAYYPESWMRTSSDIDFLVKEEQLEKAVNALMEKLNFTKKYMGSHDVSMFTPGGMHIEVHYGMVEKGKAQNANKVLVKVWSKISSEPDSFRCVMDDEMFYFYHIAHMAKHFENGGCGVRPFIDLWILNNRIEFDKEKRDKLLAEGGILTFARSAEKLSRVWFDGEKADGLCLALEEYVFYGGVYGNVQNRVSVQQAKKGGKLKYAVSRIIIPYDLIKFHYPILQKHRWLTPLYQVRRWFKLAFRGGAKRSLRELEVNGKVTETQAETAEKLMIQLGLKSEK